MLLLSCQRWKRHSNEIFHLELKSNKEIEVVCPLELKRYTKHMSDNIASFVDLQRCCKPFSCLESILEPDIGVEMNVNYADG